MTRPGRIRLTRRRLASLPRLCDPDRQCGEYGTDAAHEPGERQAPRAAVDRPRPGRARPAYRPAVPEERTPSRLENVHRDQPEAHSKTVEVLQSLENQRRVAVSGPALPPAGLSGRIRRAASLRAESDLHHCMTLLVADRVNMFEGIGEHLRRGLVPNLFAAARGGAAWRHERADTIRKSAVAGVVALVAARLTP
jgi:hypothetical protein